ncbi:MAG: phosphate ABC transporter substrate-binding protein [Candidatus Aminicenantes bacterium]|nr:phosphate ABC transporter substrate-binding protein [Candidatus Aminicenantes bacterium]
MNPKSFFRHEACLALAAVVCLAATMTCRAATSDRADQKTRALQIKGSDTMVNLGQAWAEAYAKLHPGLNMSVTGGGSGTGIAALINGTCDIAESSRGLEAKELQQAQEKGFVIHEDIVALDGIVVVVHPSNPIRRLTMEELRELFLGDIGRWRMLGGPDWPVVLLSREVNSGTHIFFKEHVLRRGKSKGPEEFSPRALMMPSSYAIAEETANNENAVGYYGLGYISPRQKVVPVAKDAASPAVLPNIETVRANSYPISRPLYLFSRGEPAGPVKDFLDYVHSPAGQQIVRDTDFVPVK